ncbi:MAG TPA: hypothetical protein DCS87_03690 [Rheinheimera sp.]|nr:hypothetical protein [Rheinheimera sp.]
MKFSRTTIAALLFVVPCFSYAQSGMGLAVTADIGYNSHGFKIDAADAGVGYDESGHATAPAVGVSYSFTDNWSVQLQYADAGNADVLTMSEESLSYTVSSDTNQINLFAAYSTERSVGGWGFGGRVGVSKWDTTFDWTASDGTQSETQELGNDSGTALIAGISTFYAINDNFDVVLSADWTKNTAAIEMTEADMTYARYAVGVSYHF